MLSKMVPHHYPALLTRSDLIASTNSIFRSNVSDTMNDTFNYPSYTGYHRDYNFPIYPEDAPESVRCGRKHMDSAKVTEVLKVQAGDKIAFAPMTAWPQTWVTTDWTDEPCTETPCGGVSFALLFSSGLREGE